MSLLKSINYFFRSVVYGSLVCGCAVYGIISSITLRLIRKKQYAQYTVAKVFYSVCGSALGIKITIKNEERLKNLPAIIVSNHQSAIDILMLGRVFQPGYTVTAKKALKYFPFLGWFMLLSGTFFIDRSNGVKARKLLQASLKQLRDEKRGLFMFVEGTRSGSDKLELLPFKKGAFHLASQAKIPVIPIVVSNYSTLFHSKTGVFKGGEIVIDVLEPLSTEKVETKEQIDELCENTRKIMQKTYESLGYAKTKSELAKKPQEIEDETEQQEETEVSVSDINTDSEGETTETTPLVKG